MTDKKIKIALVIYIVIAIILYVGVLTKYTPVLYLSFLNILAGLFVSAPWLRKYLRYRHQVELREIIVLFAECSGIIISIFFIATVRPGAWLVISQYIIAGLQLAAAILFLGFMLLFKMKKLF